jgi:hypothetical protein
MGQRGSLRTVKNCLILPLDAKAFKIQANLQRDATNLRNCSASQNVIRSVQRLSERFSAYPPIPSWR